MSDHDEREGRPTPAELDALAKAKSILRRAIGKAQRGEPWTDDHPAKAVDAIVAAALAAFRAVSSPAPAPPTPGGQGETVNAEVQAQLKQHGIGCPIDELSNLLTGIYEAAAKDADDDCLSCTSESAAKEERARIVATIRKRQAELEEEAMADGDDETTAVLLVAAKEMAKLADEVEKGCPDGE